MGLGQGAGLEDEFALGAVLGVALGPVAEFVDQVALADAGRGDHGEGAAIVSTR